MEYLVRVSAFADEPGDIDRPILQIADASGAQLAEFDGLGNEGITIEWTPETTESHIFTVSGHDAMTGDYVFGVVAEDADVTADAVATTLPIAISPILHDANDVDVFAFEAIGGTSYSLHTEVKAPIDTQLSIIAPDGTTMLASNDDESDFSTGSRLNWTAEQTGTHFVMVEATNGFFGNYELFVAEGETTPTITEAAADDFVNEASDDSEIIALFETINGQIEYRADEDWFRFQGSSRRLYNVTLTLDAPLAEPTAEQVAEDLDDAEQPHVRIFDENNELLFESPIEAGSRSTTIDFQPSSTQRIYIQVTDPSKGEYSLTLDSDDHGDNQHNARVAEIGVTISGDLETSEDSDWFRIDPTPGSIYEIRTILSGSLGDSTLRILDANGIEQLFNDDTIGLESELSWAPTSDEPFFFEVDGFSGSDGTYRVQVTELEDCLLYTSDAADE